MERGRERAAVLVLIFFVRLRERQEGSLRMLTQHEARPGASYFARLEKHILNITTHSYGIHGC